MASTGENELWTFELHISSDYVAVVDEHGPYRIWSRRTDREYYAEGVSEERLESANREIGYLRRTNFGVEEPSKVEKTSRAAIETVKSFLDSDRDSYIDGMTGRI